MSDHPATPQLLAWLDGELGALTSWRIRRHVRRCWPCRSRVSALEGAIRTVGAGLAEPSIMPSVEIGRAKWRFREAAGAFEASLSATPQPTAFPPAAWYAGAAAVVTAAICMTWMWIPHRPPAPPPASATELLSSAMRSEVPQSTGTVREDVFAVEMQVRDRPVIRRNWQVWSSPRQELYTSQWEEPGGRLRHAVFASARTTSTVYSTELGIRHIALRHEPRRALLAPTEVEPDSDPQAMESYLLAWIQRQVWEPVSLAREVAEFCSRNGSSLRLSRQAGALRWETEALVAGRRIRVVLEALEGRAPRLIEIRWRSPAGEARLHLARVRTVEGIDEKAAAAYLRPDLRLAHLTVLTSRESQEQVSMPAAQLTAAEFQIVAALHHGRLCRTDAVQVTVTEGRVRVFAPLLPPPQREQLRTLLKDLPDSALIDLHFDLPSGRPGRAAVMQPSMTAISGDNLHRATAEIWLRQRLGVGVRASEREMYDLMNVLVREAEELSSESWAVRNLAQQFSASRELLLDASSRAELHLLAVEHAEDLARNLATISAVLTSLDVRLPDMNAPAPAATENWQQLAEEIHALARQSSETLLNFFADGASTTAGEVNPDQSELPSVLGALRQKLAQFHSSMTQR